MGNIYNNDLSQFPTHFLAGPQLIKEGREKYGITSENWTYPTMTYVGAPRDDYYAEVWVDGMDWQNTYWLLEHAYYTTSVALPLIVFSSTDEEKGFNPFDLHNLFRAAMNYRKNLLGPLHNGAFRDGFFDSIWPYMHLVSESPTVSDTAPDLASFRFSHASQKPVIFYMNKTCVPLAEGIIKR